MKDRDLHPKMCKSEVRRYKMKKVITHPIDNNENNGMIFIKSYFGKRLIKYGK